MKSRRRNKKWKSEKDMYPTVQRSLAQRFPKREGWTIKEQPIGKSGTYRPDFIVWKKTNNCKKVIIVEVKNVEILTYEHIQQVNRYSQALSGKCVRIIKKIIYVPKGCDISALDAVQTSVPFEVYKI